MKDGESYPLNIIQGAKKMKSLPLKKKKKNIQRKNMKSNRTDSEYLKTQKSCCRSIVEVTDGA